MLKEISFGLQPVVFVQAKFLPKSAAGFFFLSDKTSRHKPLGHYKKKNDQLVLMYLLSRCIQIRGSAVDFCIVISD